ncbi:MAG TPA: glycosyltransferase family 39 protein [Chloroflexia bacterium]|nr:glycosyltransferase family 39 protein [Chloroflexia bacterium]
MQPLELDTPHTATHVTRRTRQVASLRAQLRARSATIELAALLSVVLLGFVLRAYGLTAYGIWFDEAYHIRLVTLPTVGEMLRAVLANPPSDPLYVLLLRPWVALFGHEDFSVRTLSVVLSTATLPATYWLGKVAAGRAAGLVGALLLAVSPYAIELGQQASLYVLATLTTTLALAAGLRWRGTGSRGDALLYIAFGIVAIYSHYVVAAILGLFGLLSLSRYAGPRPIARRAWIAAHLAIFAAWTPWLVALAASWIATPVPRATLRNPATVEQVLGALVQYSSGTAALLQRARVPEALGLLAGGLLLLSGWLAGREARLRHLRLISVMSGLIFLLPAVASAATGLWLFVPHFMVFLLPAMFVVFGAGLVRVAGWRPTGSDSLTSMLRYLPLALAAVWLVAQVWGLALFHRHPPHGADGLRELATTLNTATRPDDLVLVTPPALQASLTQYYQDDSYGIPADFDLFNLYPPYDPARWTADSLGTFERRVEGQTRFWLVYRPELDEDGKFLAEVRRRYAATEQRRYVFATLYLFEGR